MSVLMRGMEERVVGFRRIAVDQSSSLAAAARLTGYLDVIADHGEYLRSVNKFFSSFIRWWFIENLCILSGHRETAITS